PEQHLVGRAGILGMILEALALEVLYGVALWAIRRFLNEFLGEREAECRQPPITPPVVAERAAKRMPCLGEVAATGRGWVIGRTRSARQQLGGRARANAEILAVGGREPGDYAVMRGRTGFAIDLVVDCERAVGCRVVAP